MVLFDSLASFFSQAVTLWSVMFHYSPSSHRLGVAFSEIQIFFKSDKNVGAVFSVFLIVVRTKQKFVRIADYSKGKRLIKVLCSPLFFVACFFHKFQL